MKLTEIISLDCIKVPMESVTKEEAMEELVDLLVTAGKVPDRDRALEALWDRESKGSTGIGGGLAIPHAKYSDASTLIGAIGIAPDGIEFDAEDGEPVYVCVLLLAEVGKAGPHVEAMSEVVRLQSVPGLFRRLRQASGPEDLYRLIEEEE